MTQKIDRKSICTELMLFSHIKDVKQIENECFSLPWSEKSFEDSLKNPDAYFISALYYGKIIGYAGMYKSFDEGYIYNVAVKREYRCLGIGKMLVSGLCEYSIEQKLKFLSLEVRASNGPAILLYKNLGFQILGQRRNFYDRPKEDAVIMTNFLNDF